MLDRAHVEQVLSAGGYFRVFAGAAVQALQDWRDMVAANHGKMEGAVPRERAMFVNRRVIEIICNEVALDPLVIVHKQPQNTLFIIHDEIIVRCKKLTEEMRAMNIRTGRVIRLWYEQLPLRGDFEQYINVTFGWHLDEHGILQRLAIVNEYNDKPYWIIDIDEAGLKKSVIETIPLFAEEDPFEITVRDTERTRRIAEEDQANNMGDTAN